MVAGVSTSTTVLNASSPFIVTGSAQTDSTEKGVSSTLNPPSSNDAASNIANIFSPAASISLLSSGTASVLLEEQATEKPLILEDPNAPLDNSSLGTQDAFKELIPSSDNGNTNTSAPKETDTSRQTEEDSNNSFSSSFSDTIVALTEAKNTAAPPPAASLVDVSA